MRHEIHGLQIFCPYCEKELHYRGTTVECIYCSKVFECNEITIYITSRNCRLNKEKHDYGKDNICKKCGKPIANSD